MAPIACAIDVGTNTLLGLIATRDPDGSIRALDDLGHITRLGRGVDASGALAPDAIERAISALADVVARARFLGATEIRAVGTSAVRDASNRDVLIARARELGVALAAIDGAREAALTFAGALPRAAPDASRELTAVDVGGGSTEIARGRGATLERAWSVDVGSVRLFERHLATDPPSRAEIAALEADVDRALDRSGASFGGAVVALAGTACTLAAVARGIDPLDVRVVDGTTLSAREVRAVADHLAALRTAERRATPGVPAGREDVVAAGGLLLARITERAGVSEIVISDGGVRWGLARELLAPPAGGC